MSANNSTLALNAVASVPHDMRTINIIVGLIDVCFGGPAMVVTSTCIAAMFRSKEMFAKPCYKIMCVASTLEVLITLTQAFIPAVYILSEAQWEWSSMKVTGALENGFWFGYSLLVAVLSLNRSLIMWSKKWSKILFDGVRIWVWAGACIVYGAVFAIWLMTPTATKFYHNFNWSHDSAYGTQLVAECETIGNFSFCIFMLINYIIVAVGIFHQRKMTSSQRLSSAERKALASAFSSSLCMGLACSIWYSAFSNIDPLWILIIDNLVTTFMFGANGIMYLVVNETIRTEVLQMTNMARFFKPSVSHWSGEQITQAPVLRNQQTYSVGYSSTTGTSIEVKMATSSSANTTDM